MYPARATDEPVAENLLCKLTGLVAVALLCDALFSYFVYSSNPNRPALSESLTREIITVRGMQKTYLHTLIHSDGHAATLLAASSTSRSIPHGAERSGDYSGIFIATSDLISRSMLHLHA